jgi:thioredoxin-like negative regulator of GroEL
MKKTVLICMFLATLGVAWGQNERKNIRQGVRAYQEGDYSEAEVQFRKARDINQESLEAGFQHGGCPLWPGEIRRNLQTV